MRCSTSHALHNSARADGKLWSVHISPAAPPHGLPAQVAAIIAAAVIAQRRADQDVDEADMSLAYSGGSGRVSIPWHCCSHVSNPKCWLDVTLCAAIGCHASQMQACYKGGVMPCLHKADAMPCWVHMA